MSRERQHEGRDERTRQDSDRSAHALSASHSASLTVCGHL